MSAQLAAFEEDRKQYQEQLDIVLASLKDDPGNAELLGLKAELDDMVKLIDESIADLKPKQAPAAPKPAPAKKTAPSPPPVEEKWSRENHPAFKKAAQEEKEREQQQQEASAPISYQVNDTVLAKWVSGDKGFYPARITSVTGSSTAPIYTVKFKSYDTVETLRGKDIRPVSNKRKADGSSATAGSAAVGSGTPGSSSQATPATQSPSGGTPTNGIVLQAQPSVYPHAAEQAKAAAGTEEAPVKKFKKIKANKELEAGKNKWQEFSSKSKFGKTQKKDSMFRTPEGAHGRVGFTGSGQPMRKDPTRSRHIYQQNEDFD